MAAGCWLLASSCWLLAGGGSEWTGMDGDGAGLWGLEGLGVVLNLGDFGPDLRWGDSPEWQWDGVRLGRLRVEPGVANGPGRARSGKGGRGDSGPGLRREDSPEWQWDGTRFGRLRVEPGVANGAGRARSGKGGAQSGKCGGQVGRWETH